MGSRKETVPTLSEHKIIAVKLLQLGGEDEPSYGVVITGINNIAPYLNPVIDQLGNRISIIRVLT